MTAAVPDLPLRVLVIDDQQTMRSILRELLHQVGVTDVDEAADGEIALALISDPHADFPDLIICDLHMDNMDGMQFCNAVRRSEKLHNSGVPIIILTGDRDKLLHEVARQVGAVSVVTKPVTAEDLKSLIQDKVGFTFGT